MLFNQYGEPHLSWIVDVSLARYRGRLGLSDQQYRAFMRQWPRSEQGRRLLEGLRWAWWGCVMAAALHMPAANCGAVHWDVVLPSGLNRNALSPIHCWQGRQRGGLAAAACAQ